MVSKAKILADITNSTLNTNNEKKTAKSKDKTLLKSLNNQESIDLKQTKIFEELQNNQIEDITENVNPKSKSKQKAQSTKKQKQVNSDKKVCIKRQKCSDRSQSPSVHHSETSECDYRISLSRSPSPKAEWKAVKPKKRELKKPKGLYETNKTTQKQFSRLSKAKDLILNENIQSNISDEDYKFELEDKENKQKCKVGYKQGLKKLKKAPHEVKEHPEKILVKENATKKTSPDKENKVEKIKYKRANKQQKKTKMVEVEKEETSSIDNESESIEESEKCLSEKSESD